MAEFEIKVCSGSSFTESVVGSIGETYSAKNVDEKESSASIMGQSILRCRRLRACCRRYPSGTSEDKSAWRKTKQKGKHISEETADLLHDPESFQKKRDSSGVPEFSASKNDTA